jgi:hypothetical protein
MPIAAASEVSQQGKTTMVWGEVNEETKKMTKKA